MYCDIYHMYLICITCIVICITCIVMCITCIVVCITYTVICITCIVMYVTFIVMCITCIVMCINTCIVKCITGILNDAEKLQAGNLRIVSYFILATHIPLAAIILPFILFTAYRALTGEYSKHKKLVRITWPVWLYVALTGVIVYFLISPYYQ